MKNYNLQYFAGSNYDGGEYCDFSQTAAAAVAGKDIILGVFNSDGSQCLAVAGQQGLSIARGAESIEVTSKDTVGGWKSFITGMKEWSIDNDGLYILDSNSHKALSTAFENGDPVCLRIDDRKHTKPLFGGLACITQYDLEAPYDDSMTYSISFQGMGALTDLSDTTIENPVTMTY